MIQPKTDGQRAYIDAIRKNIITFCTGLPGTGKTFLACREAVSQLKAGAVQKIVITRPIVDAGEHIGYLPGTLEEKTKPYLMPVLDGVGTFLNNQGTSKKFADCIEVAPLAYMRGRTFWDSFMILDEAQNATFEQLKMFVTRIGTGSKIVITGDLEQSDIDDNGLRTFIKKLADIPNVGMVGLTKDDIVRHPIIGMILEKLG